MTPERNPIRTLHPLGVTPHASLPTAPGNHKSTLCLCGFPVNGVIVRGVDFVTDFSAGFFKVHPRVAGTSFLLITK